MKRASYKDAIAWIAENDSAGDIDALTPDTVHMLVSAVLVADIFGVDPDKIGKDVVRYRIKNNIGNK